MKNSSRVAVAQSGSQTFRYPGKEQDFEVPSPLKHFGANGGLIGGGFPYIERGTTHVKNVQAGGAAGNGKVVTSWGVLK
jgi:hypothetical protein